MLATIAWSWLKGETTTEMFPSPVTEPISSWNVTQYEKFKIFLSIDFDKIKLHIWYKF